MYPDIMAGGPIVWVILMESDRETFSVISPWIVMFNLLLITLKQPN